MNKDPVEFGEPWDLHQGRMWTLAVLITPQYPRPRLDLASAASDLSHPLAKSTLPTHGVLNKR